jgi:nucleoside-diphosphate-sugar epimerase
MNDKKPRIYGDGEQSRDFTFVSNVVEANILASTKDCQSGVVLNCACNEKTTVNQLVKELNAILDKNITPEYTEPRAGEVKESCAAIERAKMELGYFPQVNFKDGLRKTAEWYMQSGK